MSIALQYSSFYVLFGCLYFPLNYVYVGNHMLGHI